MEILSNLLHYGLSFVIIISVIVFVHEWGHYIVARMCGVRVEEFSIGFGKELKGWNDKHGTRWKICALPFGGFVKMYGDAGGASNADNELLNSMTEEQKAVSFHYKPLWQKSAVVVAGPAINFVFAILIYMSIFSFYGKLELNAPPLASEVIKGGAADQIGMKAGDLVVELDGKQIKLFTDLQEVIRNAPLEKMEIKYKRGEEIITSIISPKFEEVEDDNGNKVKFGMIGIKRPPLEVEEMKSVKLGLVDSFVAATDRVYKDCSMMLKGLKQIITGVRSTKELGGPVKIMEYSGQSTGKFTESVACYFNGGKDCGDMAVKGLLITLIFMGMLSTMLGMMNLFPIPMLDGGHLLFYAIAAITRRNVADKVQEWAFRAGFAFLISMMLYVTYNDVVSFIDRHINT